MFDRPPSRRDVTPEAVASKGDAALKGPRNEEREGERKRERERGRERAEERERETSA